MALKGNVSDLRNLKRRIKNAPRHVAHEVAQRTAPDLTRLSRKAFSSGRTVYGQPRPAGRDGQQLSLVQTGRLQRSIQFKSAGTIVRAVLAVKYARFLIGKYKILPIGRLPRRWSETISQNVSEVTGP